MHIEIRAVRSDEYSRAAELLFPEAVAMHGKMVERREFLRKLEAMGYDLSHAIVAVSDGRLVGVMMELPAPDGTVLVARPRLADPRAAEAGRIERELIAYCRDRARKRGRIYLQSLSTVEDEATRAVFAEAGFTHGVTLLHLRLDPSRFPNDADAAPPPPELAFTSYSDETHPRFAATIDRTYNGTRDCPNIPRVHDVDRVIETHKEAGRFDPALWRLASDERGEFGVILINEEPNRDCYDLVYMGVTPERRGEGLGRHVLEEGIRQVEVRRVRPIELAVDETNAPAVRLYQRRGFEPVGRSVAMICKV